MRVIIIQHDGHTTYEKATGFALEHLELLLGECKVGAEIVVSIGDIDREDFEDLPEFEGY